MAVGPYSRARYQGGFLGTNAWLKMLNPIDTIRAMVSALGMAAQDYQNRQGQRMTDSQEDGTTTNQEGQGTDGYHSGRQPKRW